MVGSCFRTRVLGPRLTWWHDLADRLFLLRQWSSIYTTYYDFIHMFLCTMCSFFLFCIRPGSGIRWRGMTIIVTETHLHLLNVFRWRFVDISKQTIHVNAKVGVATKRVFLLNKKVVGREKGQSSLTKKMEMFCSQNYNNS